MYMFSLLHQASFPDLLGNKNHNNQTQSVTLSIFKFQTFLHIWKAKKLFVNVVIASFTRPNALLLSVVSYGLEGILLSMIICLHHLFLCISKHYKLLKTIKMLWLFNTIPQPTQSILLTVGLLLPLIGLKLIGMWFLRDSSGYVIACLQKSMCYCVESSTTYVKKGLLMQQNFVHIWACLQFNLREFPLVLFGLSLPGPFLGGLKIYWKSLY